MGSIRRWRGLIVLGAVWVVVCFYFFGPRSSFRPKTLQVPFSLKNGNGQDSNPATWKTPPRPLRAPPTPPGETRWEKRPDRYPVANLLSLPTSNKIVKIPKVQAEKPIESAEAREVRLTRKQAVLSSFKHSWIGYQTYAWLQDEVTPLSHKAKNPFGGWAATLVDALDTLWIMGLEAEFEKAVKACEEIDFTHSESSNINVFETTIRYLGGLMGAYEISGKKYPILLRKSIEVGDFLMSAFDTPNRLPVTRWDWKEYVRGAQQVAGNYVIVSEIGSLSLEFTKLTQLTDDNKYYDAIQRISNEFEQSQSMTSLPGMWPIIVDAASKAFHTQAFYTLGGMSDSLYEYLPKQYLMLGGHLEQPRTLYENFIKVAKKHLFSPALNPENRQIMISGDVRTKHNGDEVDFEYDYKGQHLTCFSGGMVALASRIFDRPEDLETAVQLTEGCVWSYNATQSGLGPEIFSFMPCNRGDGNGAGAITNDCTWSDEKWRGAVADRWVSKTTDEQMGRMPEQINAAIEGQRLPTGMPEVEDRRYILRPEAVESIFILYRITGDASWADKAWAMFQRVEALTRTDVAAAALADVTLAAPTKMDSMESFWLAETLKYYFLMFSDWDTLSLDEWVLNTEAHPLRRPVQ